MFDAWTSPKHLMQWFGPRGFTVPYCEVDLKPGGAWRLTMRGRDGKDYPNTGIYREVTRPSRLDLRPGGAFRIVQRGPDGQEYPFKGEYREVRVPERIVHTFIFDVEGLRDRVALVTVTFQEHNGKTTLTSTTLFETPEDLGGALESGMEAGALETLDRLAEHLAGGREIAVTRLLEAPRDLVFAAFTDPKQVVQWWGPNGFTTTTHEMDVRPGGIWRYTMHGPDGRDYKNKIVYQEVAKPKRLVYRRPRALRLGRRLRHLLVRGPQGGPGGDPHDPARLGCARRPGGLSRLLDLGLPGDRRLRLVAPCRFDTGAFD